MKKEITVRLDSRNRVHLGKVSKKLHQTYKAYEKDGKIILEPYVEIPAHEQWLYEPENKHILKMLNDAIESAQKNPKKGKSWNAIKKALKIDIDEEE